MKDVFRTDRREKTPHPAIFRLTGLLASALAVCLFLSACGNAGGAQEVQPQPQALPDDPKPETVYEGSPRLVSLDDFWSGDDTVVTVAGRPAELRECEAGRLVLGFPFSAHLTPQLRERAAEAVWRDAEGRSASIEGLRLTDPFAVGPRSILVYAVYTVAGDASERGARMLFAWEDDGSFALAECEKGVFPACETAPQLPYIDPDAKTDGKPPYLLSVNKTANVVTVYTLGASGEYDVPVRAMPCSTAREGFRTPSGDFALNNFRAAWCYMVDGTYGQYAYSFYQDWLFHSVCYEKKDPSTLLTEEYDLLGSVASRGCVRLQVGDAKWVFENCRVGTPVHVYEDEDPGPLGKPETAVPGIGEAANGWDPTDPRPENPWNALF